MSTCQLRMSQLYSLTSLRDTSSPQLKPSNRGSGLGGLFSPVSLSGLTTLKETPAKAGDPGPEPKKNVVVVIGAGISGLRAAAVLQRHGVEVVVVEAREWQYVVVMPHLVLTLSREPYRRPHPHHQDSQRRKGYRYVPATKLWLTLSCRPVRVCSIACGKHRHHLQGGFTISPY